MAAPDLERLNRRWQCTLTTIGRTSGRPRTVVIWFVLDGATAYLTGGKENPHWCRNIRANGAVTLEVAGATLHGTARVIDEPVERRAIMDRFPKKYVLARLARPFGAYTDSVCVVVDLDLGNRS